MRAGGGPSMYGTFCRRSRTVSRSNASVSEYSSPSPTAGLKSYRARPTSWPPCAVSIAIRTSVSAESGSTTRRPCHSQRALLWRPRVSSGRDTPSQARQNNSNSVEQKRRATALHKNEIEEHTSELQSRFDLVCRLPPEKKVYDTSVRRKSRITPPSASVPYSSEAPPRSISTLSS